MVFSDILHLQHNIIIFALIAGLFTFLLNGFGCLGVIFAERVNPKFFSLTLGISGGVMISASFWSLLNPAIEITKESYSLPFLPVVIGFVIGVLLLRAIDHVVPHLHIASISEEQEGPRIPLKKGLLIFFAMTIHNIPEGLAVGVTIGGVKADPDLLTSALNLSLGIGIQNIPEGLALVLALRHAGFSKMKSFIWGALSALAEPAFSIIGAVATMQGQLLLPYALSLAGGAMIFVTIEELLPEAQKYGNSDIASVGFGLGFVIMMILDTMLG